MNLEKHIKDISDRLDKISNNGNGNDSNENDEFKDYDDEYYLDIKSEPPRFAYYRQVRIDKCTDEYRKKTFECVHDSITQDELDYYLKAKLRVSSEERYQDKKKEPWWHESSYIKRTGKDGYDGYGCHHLYGCIPECRFYAEYGRIEDDEVREEHNKLVESCRQDNYIVEPPSEAELLKLAKIYRFI